MRLTSLALVHLPGLVVLPGLVLQEPPTFPDLLGLLAGLAGQLSCIFLRVLWRLQVATNRLDIGCRSRIPRAGLLGCNWENLAAPRCGMLDIPFSYI